MKNFKFNYVYSFYVACNPLEKIKLKCIDVLYDDILIFSVNNCSSKFWEKYAELERDFICFDNANNYYRASALATNVYALEKIDFNN